MGLLSRFKRIVKSNVNASLENTKDPEKALDDFFRSANMELGKIKAEVASAQAEMNTAKRALEESNSEINKLQRYAEKAAEANNDEDARKFLERKKQQAAKHSQLQAAYKRAEAKAASMQQIQNKLTADVDRLEARRLELKTKLSEARMQQQINAAGSNDVFRAMEEEANRLLDEAAAIAELSQDGSGIDLDEKFRQLEQETASVVEKDEAMNVEQELFAIKENLKKKE